jgi:hypothetical protein
MGNMSVVVIFLQISYLLYTQAVQYGINFDNSVEIHLTHRK